MKRSPPCSSSSSSAESKNDHQSKKLMTKPTTSRVGKKPKQKNCQTTNGTTDQCPTPTSFTRSSIYRGVTKHRWTGRFEAHLWDKSTWNSIQNKKGRQIYLGAYDDEEAAASTYDLAALKYWGPDTTLNFPVERYNKELEEMQKVSKEEYLASLRRKSSGFSRGVSKYRGVARHHHNGRWEARIGRVLGNKYLYLGTYSTQEEAAAAYDIAAIEYRGPNAVTNFDISTYADRLKKFLPQVQTQQLNPDDLTESQADDQQNQQEEKQVVVELPNHEEEKQPENSQVISSLESYTMEVMDTEHEQANPWTSCLDMGVNLLPVPDIPLEKPGESAYLFNDTSFDDINFIFDDGSSIESFFNFNQAGLFEDDALAEGDEKMVKESTSLPSSSSSVSSSSTNTSVSCIL